MPIECWRLQGFTDEQFNKAEATGLTDGWRKAADAHIKIPMLGKLDSLNVSVSAAILMFEAVRQRNS
jgi:TrmH family RNA methyltransferase